MAGGELNLAATGAQNILINGNPKKSYFKTSYVTHTNFGLQKFRVNYEGSRTLRLTEESTFTFKIPRYGDLLMDSYLSVNLPHIWSPIMPPQDNTNSNEISDRWIPYEFKWIDNLGAKMISKISITCGNSVLQEYTGDYLLACVQRDFSTDKKALFDKMIGNVPEINDPANSGARVNSYPNAFYTESLSGPEPSIRGRTLYIPLNNWFSLKSTMAFPLVALQYNELHIVVTFRPISQLFRIRDVFDAIHNFPYVAPNFNLFYMQMYRFLQPPPDVCIGIDSYSDTRSIWDADIHLNCTYAFLDDMERNMFATNNQQYLIRQVVQKNFKNVTGPNKLDLQSLGLVSSLMFYFQRSDVNLRNEWSNYTNWPYGYLPSDLVLAPTDGTFEVMRTDDTGVETYVNIGPGVNPDGTLTGWLITGLYSIENDKHILQNLALLLDGLYRENTQPVGVFNLIEKYTRTSGNAPDGLYCYNFCINSNAQDINPSGAINMSRFKNVELEFNTIVPPVDPLAQTLTICDPETGNIIGINKTSWQLYQYNFDLTVFEERLNIIQFSSGNCGLTFAT